ncbi:hypothetical protein ISS21_00685 [Patescibacteria group bacterium]|nr:hypothetical protein [Patescibacteria group bacterium]
MDKKISKKLLKQLQNSFTFEEKAIMEFQFDCYRKLPGNLNEKETERVRKILDIIMVQSLNHANIISDLILKLYERTAKKL